MTDRVLLRSGTALAPPGFMRPGELAYSPQDFRLWIGDGSGTAQPIFDATGAGGGGSGLTSFQGRTTAAAVLTSGDVTGALGFTPSAFSGAYASLTGKPTLFDGAYSSLTGKPTLGGAAALNVGTATGTVAAGDDSRITGALSAATAASTYAPLASPTIDTATLTNTTNFGSNGAAGVALQVNAPATINRRIAWLTAGSPRWRVGVVGASESGSNAGSDFSFTSYNDAGTQLQVPMTISRATGTVDMTAAGSVLVPTALAGDSTPKAASTAFVTNAISGLGGGGVSLAVAGTDPVPVINGTAAVGSSAKAAREDHVHPTDTSRLSVTIAASTYLPLAGGALTGAITVSPGAVAGLTVDNSGAAGSAPAATLTNTTGGGGANLRLLGDGATAPGKYLRASGGAFQILNDAYNAVLLGITDAGTVSLATALPVASGGTGATTAAAARTSLGVSAFAWDVGFDQGAVVQAGTIVVVRKAPFACTITSLDYEVGSAGGSFTVAVQIAGTSVTGLSAVAVSSSTSANAAASGANTVTAGQAVTLVISSVTGSPTGANLQINGTR